MFQGQDQVLRMKNGTDGKRRQMPTRNQVISIASTENHQDFTDKTRRKKMTATREGLKNRERSELQIKMKMSHLNFSISAFSTNFCPFKIDLSGNTV